MEKKELVIIGGGPAGLSAGLYGSRAKLDTVLLERGIPGGLVISTDQVENYPGFPEGIGGFELMQKMEEQARRFGLEIVSVNVESIRVDGKGFCVKTEDGELLAGAVIIATGAQPQLLGVKGEEQYTGRGVSYCATCDGAFFRGKKVAVIGGGDAAVQEAIFLTKFAEKVFIIHRRNELRATRAVQEKAFGNPKIEFVWDAVVSEISGSDLVESVTVKNVKNGEERDLQVDGVFIYVGQKPNSDLVRDIVSLDEKGYIITDENMMTSQPGLYAAGDVRRKLLRQVVTAVADGAVAAVAAEKYLEEAH
ncbi:MAG: thioredoxin-disulfide reductase [Pelotomaculum sp.]|uniref:Thioredoxin reductase n=1 Tax=Pelotomaculum thermopropionicum (strain DSM 13744 / JCM 10971 / SI) TaxID=370438 RepID=A5D2B9_PELTS|nr:thioredoxin-disulfide reductase [Pelotomaculum sp.]BAF59598.1 thioredoxin reductase [Pelotomaculum thermopropionicum SI]